MKTKKNKRISKKTKGGLYFDPLRENMTIYVSIDGNVMSIRLSKKSSMQNLITELNKYTSNKIIKISYGDNILYKNGIVEFIGALNEFKSKTLQVTTFGTLGKFTKKDFAETAFLKTKCISSGDCLVFGKYIDQVNEYFNYFSDFSLASGNIKPIGKDSANGFICEIKYEKYGYTAYSILKSSKSQYADNLAYEYIVGTQFINTIIKRFPCFLYTYELYYYTSQKEYNEIYLHYKLVTDKKEKETIIDSTYDAKLLSTAIQVSKLDDDKICPYSKYACILVQHVHNSVTLADMLKENGAVFIMSDLIYILFIIYHTLHSLRGIFTHYDLHANNILLVKLPPGKCIEYVYHVEDGLFTFRSRYVPKIIDYGRCFFDNTKISSMDIKHKLCTIPSCNVTKPCGYSNGFGYFNQLNPIPLLSYQSNQRYDLILLRLVGQYIKPNYEDTPVYKLLSKVTRNQNENLIIEEVGKEIFNVSDAYNAIKTYCVQNPSNLYKDYVVLQTIHVHDGNDMTIN
jgi:hypothetical protein